MVAFCCIKSCFYLINQQKGIICIDSYARTHARIHTCKIISVSIIIINIHILCIYLYMKFTTNVIFMIYCLAQQIWEIETSFFIISFIFDLILLQRYTFTLTNINYSTQMRYLIFIWQRISLISKYLISMKWNDKKCYIFIFFFFWYFVDSPIFQPTFTKTVWTEVAIFHALTIWIFVSRFNL